MTEHICGYRACANTRGIVDWTNRMAMAYGGTVHDIEGPAWDWGQALARECYGTGWADMPIEHTTDADLDRALSWEAGDWPEWVVR